MGRHSGALLLVAGIGAACNAGLPYEANVDLRTSPPGSPDLSLDLATQGLADLAPPAPDLACVARDSLTRQAMPRGVPIDFLVVIDNTLPANVLGDFESTVVKSFAAPMDQQGLDYRMIFLTRHGDAMTGGVCIPPPLSNNNCAAPINGAPKWAKRYFHYDVEVSSGTALQVLLETLYRGDKWQLAPNGWGNLLRPTALVYLVIVAGDESGLSATGLDFMLRVLDPISFGNAKKRNYVTAAIVGIPAGKVLGPMAPVEMIACGSFTPGIEFQQLAILTNGLRLSLCDGFAKTLRDLLTQSVFKASPAAVLLPCSITPDLPPGLATGAVAVSFTPSMPKNSPKVALLEEKDEAACGIMPLSFYRAGETVTLCPATCKRVQQDDSATLTIDRCLVPR